MSKVNTPFIRIFGGTSDKSHEFMNSRGMTAPVDSSCMEPSLAGSDASIRLCEPALLQEFGSKKRANQTLHKRSKKSKVQDEEDSFLRDEIDVPQYRASEQNRRKQKGNLAASEIQELKNRIKCLEERVQVLEKESKQQKEEIKQQKGRINQMEKELYEEREDCRSFIYAFKGISTFKTIGYKLKSQITLDKQEQLAISHHARVVASKGTSLQKRPAVHGLHDAQNWDGHPFISEDTIDDCLRLLKRRPYVFSYYDIFGGTVQGTVKVIESARKDVKFVNQYVKRFLSGGSKKAKTRSQRSRRTRNRFTKPSVSQRNRSTRKKFTKPSAKV